MTEMIVYVVLGLPLVWSALAAGLRRAMARTAGPDDLTEKYLLLIMLAPVALGFLWLGLSRLMPVHVPLAIVIAEYDTAPEALSAVAASPHITHAIEWRRWVMPAVLAAYAVGAVVRSAPLITAFIRLSGIVRRATPDRIAGALVRITTAPVPPIAWGASSIVLPQGLVARMTPQELSLIVRHEGEHLRRRDPLFFAVLGWVDALVWFNPFVRAQTARCRLAAELACDAAVTRDCPTVRETYAMALIGALKHAAGDALPCAPAVFSNANSGDYRMRIEQIMHPGATPRKPKRWLYAALAAAVLPIVVAQFAWAQGNAPVSASQMKTVPVAAPQSGMRQFSVLPVDGPIVSPYGMRKDPLGPGRKFHHGVDFAAASGTPVKAPADATVGATYANAKDGKVLELDYGGGVTSRMTHLSATAVKWGETVRAGDVVATSGATGTNTGPHLHFEVRVDRKPVDPETVMHLQ